MRQISTFGYLLAVAFLLMTLSGCGGDSGGSGATVEVAPNNAPEITKLDLNIDDDSLEVITYFQANDGSAIDHVFIKITSPSGKIYSYDYNTNNNYLNGSSNSILLYLSYDVFDIDGIYTIETYVNNEESTSSTTYSSTTYIDLPGSVLPEDEKPEVLDIVFDKGDSTEIKISTSYNAQNGSAIDYIYWKVISPGGAIYTYEYDTEENYVDGLATLTMTYEFYDVFDVDGTYTIETYVKNEDGTSSSTYSETTYIDLPDSLVPENEKPTMDYLEFDQGDSTKIKISTSYYAQDGSAIDYIYWTVTSPSGAIYAYEYDTEENYIDGLASLTMTYELYDVFDVDGTYTIETYVKNEDGIFSSTYSGSTYIDLDSDTVPENERPEVTDLEFDQSDSTMIKMKTYFNAQDGSAIDYVYWTITSPRGATYSYEYDTDANHLDGWAFIQRTYELYDVFDVDGTYTIETYVKNEDGIFSRSHSETTYIDFSGTSVAPNKPE